MPIDVRSCPLCGSEHSRLFDQREFRGQPVINRVCQDCGLVYQSPRMTETEAVSFYTDEYRLLYEGSADPTARNLANQQGRVESLYSFSRPYLDSVARHLDIGCSFGLLLQRFQEAYHCQAFGIEPGDGHRAYACKEGLTVFATLEELEKSEKTRFDLITMSHVLEHLPDPVGYLKHLRIFFLEPNGWLLIEVPNLYAHDSFETAHLLSFSHHTLAQTLGKAGFEICNLEEHGRPRSKLLPLYISLLTRPVSSDSRTWSLLPEKQVMQKRKFGLFRRHILERLFPGRTWLP